MSYVGGGYAGYGDGGYYGEGGYNEQGAFPQQQAATGSFYPEQHQQQQQSFAGWEAPSYSTPQTSDGYYFAVDVLETGGAPINSLAYDQHFEALYVASKVTRGRQSSSQLSTHLPDGQLYASVLAHPPASPSIRETLPNSDANFLSLTPLPHGMVLSTSLAGARLHTPGGLPVAHCAHEGLACATASAYGIVVGGWEQALLLDATLQKVRTYRCPNVTLTCMATSSSTVVGGSDGNVRLLDAHVRQVAQVPSHPGGVGSIAVSPDGTLFATTGQHLDPTVLLYDIRYLGRRGIPHAFSGLGGGPKHVQFLPDVEGLPTNRLLVGSGLSGGGLEIIVPFEEASGNKDNYMIPPLERGDRVAAMALWEDQLSLGTARGKIYRYQMQGYSNLTRRQSLEIPSFYPEPPALSLGTESLKHGESQSIAGSYALTTEPMVSAISKDSPLAGVFGRASHIPVIGGSRLTIPNSTLAKASHVMDFLRTIPTSSLGVDLSLDHRPEAIKARMKGAWKNPLENPNKLLYTDSIYHDVYGESLNRNKKSGRKSRRGTGGEEGVELPRRYKLTLRPANKSVAAFGYVDYNDFGLLPGWDYPPTMPNAFIPSVLMLLYLVPEIRNSLLEGVLVGDRASFLLKEKLLTPELAFVFHRIETLYQNGMVFPTAQRNNMVPRVHAWSPSNFIACLTSMPEAEQLQILDGSPAAVDTPRRAEAFFRFLIYQLDKEMGKARSLKPIESLSGMSFTSINTFVSQTSDPTFSSSQALTVDLVYDGLAEKASFSAVLKNSLHRVKRLPSYNSNTGGYETIVQRKVATSLPEMLSISCACAGRKEEEGLRVWRGTDVAWLPELLEVTLEENGDVLIREGSRSGDSSDIEWTTATPTTDLPAFDSNTLKEARSKGTILKRQYRLEYVLSLVRDDMDRDCPAAFTEMENDDKFGHHVLHARVTKQQQGTLLREQRAVLEGALGLDLDSEQGRSTTIGGDSTIASFEERIQHIDGQLAKLDGENADDAWVLFNGFAVSSTVSEDARSFYPKFKEPSLVVFRAMSEETESPIRHRAVSLPMEILKTNSITDGSRSKYFTNLWNGKPLEAGDIIAFDAEFVSVQEEEYVMTENASRVTVRDTRHSVARISLIDCTTRQIIVDDHVLPREPVADYLTRFSGIVEKDLNPKQSPHHLISTRAAYLKLRYFVERGCIFLGHGLSQDFWTMNLAVPASQIIDTVSIYHKPAHRYISLRFLTNYVLQRDLQQEVHDSVEDALAAYELYQRAIERKAQGTFEDLLNELYAHGEKTDWKLGVAEE